MIVFASSSSRGTRPVAQSWLVLSVSWAIDATLRIGLR